MTDETPSEDLRAGHDPRVPTRDLRAKRERALELERRMVRMFGPDFRTKAIVGPLGGFRLAGVFDECGLADPRAVERGGSYGLWQVMAPRTYVPQASPTAQARAALERYRR